MPRFGNTPRNKGKGKGIEWLRAHAAYDGDDCLIWPFSTARGYGHLGVDGKLVYAHTVMCELVNGPAPTPEHQAAHSCGRGHEACVSGKHLSWKTQSGNQLDRRVHGTKNEGNGWKPKLSWEQVQEIRALASTKTHDELAAQFNTSRRNIGSIINGKSRKHFVQSTEQRLVIGLIKDAGRALGPKDILAAGKFNTEAAVWGLIAKLMRDGHIKRSSRGKYDVDRGNKQP